MTRIAYTLLLVLTLPALARAQEEPGDDDAPAVDLRRPQVELEAGGHTALVQKVFFTPDDKQVVTVGRDSTVRYWDVATGERTRVLRPPFRLNRFSGAHAAAITPDGKTLVLHSGNEEPKSGRQMLFLDVARGQVSRMLQVKQVGKGVYMLAISPDGKYLALTGGTSLTSVWDAVAGGKILFRIDAKGQGHPNAVAFSSDSTRFALTTLHGGLRVFAVPSGNLLHDFGGSASAGLAWDPRHPILALGHRDSVSLWDTEKKERFKELPGGAREFLAWSTDGKRLLRPVHGVFTGQVEAVDAADGTGARKYHFTTDKGFPPTDAAFSHDSQLVAAVSSYNGELHLWRVQEGKPLWHHGGKGSPVLAVGWSADGKAIAFGHEGTQVVKVDRRTLQHAFDLTALEHRTGADRDAVLNSLKRHVVERDGAILKRKTPSFAVTIDGKTFGMDPGQGQASCATLLPGRRVAIGTPRGEIVLFEPLKREKGNVGRLQGHGYTVTDVAPSPDGRFLLSGSLDQTVRIWNVETPGKEKLLLSCFFADQDWIAWTPEGYYAATPGGEKLMGWSVFHAFDKLKSFYPAERFRKQLYRPDVIKLVLEKGNLKDALAAANAVRRKEGHTVAEGVADVSKLLPPQATLQVEGQGGAMLTVKASAVAGVTSQPIVAVRLLLDGRPLPEAPALRLEPGKAKAETQWTIAPPPGKHQLSLLVRSPDASAVSEPVAIEGAAPPSQATLHVLTVGVNDYPEPALRLDFARQDAEALAAGFRKHCQGPLFAKVNAAALLDGQGRKQGVLDAISAIRKSARQDDLFVLFFAGHGVKEKDEFYLLTAEAITGQLAKTALAGTELRRALGEFPCQVLLMLDACHSAGFGKGRKLTQTGLRPATDDATRALTDDDVAVAVLCAAMGEEKALERGGHGLFTQALLEAIALAPGVPRHPQSQRLYVHHLHSYVFDQVSDRSAGRQRPFLSLPWVVPSFPLR